MVCNVKIAIFFLFVSEAVRKINKQIEAPVEGFIPKITLTEEGLTNHAIHLVNDLVY
ncbi:hypothetical protein QNK12_03690 [Neobacillus cucumis]|nr:hypothetical protein QNK12_03690 [Neobacillus cucumis]